MDVIHEYFEADMIAKNMDMKIEEVSPGRAVVTMPISAKHKNGLDAVHGGAIFSLADFCFAVASNSHGRAAVAINCAISFFKPALSGTLTATAKELHLGERIGGYVVDITDDAGALVSTMQAQVYRKRDTIASIVEKRRAAGK